MKRQTLKLIFISLSFFVFAAAGEIAGAGDYVAMAACGYQTTYQGQNVRAALALYSYYGFDSKFIRVVYSDSNGNVVSSLKFDKAVPHLKPSSCGAGPQNYARRPRGIVV